MPSLIYDYNAAGQWKVTSNER